MRISQKFRNGRKDRADVQEFEDQYSRALILHCFYAGRVFTFLSQDEVERMKQEEGNCLPVGL
jgi:hypothetical protein